MTEANKNISVSDIMEVYGIKSPVSEVLQNEINRLKEEINKLEKF